MQDVLEDLLKDLLEDVLEDVLEDLLEESSALVYFVGRMIEQLKLGQTFYYQPMVRLQNQQYLYCTLVLLCFLFCHGHQEAHLLSLEGESMIIFALE